MSAKLADLEPLVEKSATACARVCVRAHAPVAVAFAGGGTNRGSRVRLNLQLGCLLLTSFRLHMKTLCSQCVLHPVPRVVSVLHTGSTCGQDRVCVYVPPVLVARTAHHSHTHRSFGVVEPRTTHSRPGTRKDSTSRRTLKCSRGSQFVQLLFFTCSL
jgi:hypothetical protein